MTYWVYENWTIDKAVSHQADCSFCNNGRGVHPDAGTRNGEWHGPFRSREEAATFAGSTGRRVIRPCVHCLGGQTRALN